MGTVVHWLNEHGLPACGVSKLVVYAMSHRYLTCTRCKIDWHVARRLKERQEVRVPAGARRLEVAV